MRRPIARPAVFRLLPSNINSIFPTGYPTIRNGELGYANPWSVCRVAYIEGALRSVLRERARSNERFNVRGADEIRGEPAPVTGTKIFYAY